MSIIYPQKYNDMKFTKEDGVLISDEKAIAMTKRFRELKEKAGEKDYIKAHFYGANLLNTLLDQPKAVGLRFYYANDAENSDIQELVIVAVDENGLEIMKLFGDGSKKCPPFCSSSSLNE